MVKSPISTLFYKGNIDKLLNYISALNLQQSFKIETLNFRNLNKAAEYDAKHGGLLSAEFWNEWAKLTFHKSVIAFDADENLVAFGVCFSTSDNELRM